ncbi:MAG TPA: universal stress protein [Gaiellaceae bacterium]|nr:universal stress protein [Gaiellaceae bacterium]
MNVVVGYDGSEPAQRALGVAVAVAGKGEVTVVNVAPALHLGLPDPAFAAEQEFLLAEALRLAGDGEVATKAVVGEPAEELSAAAREAGADVLVVGTAGHGALGRFLLGSVSLAVAREAPCSVLVVP